MVNGLLVDFIMINRHTVKRSKIVSEQNMFEVILRILYVSEPIPVHMTNFMTTPSMRAFMLESSSNLVCKKYPTFLYHCHEYYIKTLYYTLLN